VIYLTPREIDELDEEKLRTFLQKKYRENRFLDYKLKYEKRNDEETKEEFLADVTAFANYYGGNIIVGVNELEEEGASSQPGELEGINDGKILAERFSNLCETSIDPIIPGLIIKEIPLKNVRWAIVVYIPPSLRKPHMVNFNRKREFYIKRDDRKGKMTADEVKRTVLEVINLQNDMNSYIKMVEEEIIEDFIGYDFALIMHSVPYLLEEGQIDTSSEMIKSALYNNSLFINYSIDIRTSYSIANIHGIVGQDSYHDPFIQSYIHRTGYIGLAINFQKRFAITGIKDKIIYPSKNDFLSFLRLSELIIERAQIAQLYQVRSSFINAKGAVCRCERIGGFERQSNIVWKRDRINLPGVRLDSFQDIDKVAELFFKRLKNAFGME